MNKKSNNIIIISIAAVFILVFGFIYSVNNYTDDMILILKNQSNYYKQQNDICLVELNNTIKLKEELYNNNAIVYYKYTILDNYKEILIDRIENNNAFYVYVIKNLSNKEIEDYTKEDRYYIKQYLEKENLMLIKLNNLINDKDLTNSGRIEIFGTDYERLKESADFYLNENKEVIETIDYLNRGD